MENMIDIKNLAEQTGLRTDFIGKCYRDLKDTVLQSPMTEKGDKNSTWFSTNAVAIFLKIRAEKERGLPWPKIRKKLFSDFELSGEKQKNSESEQTAKQEQEKTKVASDKEIDRITDLQNKLREAERLKFEMEKEKLRVEGDLKEVRAAVRPYLTDGGGVDSLHHRFNEYNKNMSQIQLLVDQLEKSTTSHWLWKHSSEVGEKWEKVKELIQECLKG